MSCYLAVSDPSLLRDARFWLSPTIGVNRATTTKRIIGDTGGLSRSRARRENCACLLRIVMVVDQRVPMAPTLHH